MIPGVGSFNVKKTTQTGSLLPAFLPEFSECMATHPILFSPLLSHTLLLTMITLTCLHICLTNELLKGREYDTLTSVCCIPRSDTLLGM